MSARLPCPRLAVYPRVCGGTRYQPDPKVSHQGLSPRVRGNRSVPAAGQPDAGSIPACAGEPRGGSPVGMRGGVYPRVCGGTHRVRQEARMIEGLSPRVRGNPINPPDPRMEGRSIPACAGEPDGVRGAIAKRGVYPRVCGGTRWEAIRNSADMGLSPRVRGNRTGLPPRRLSPRSIPACAGEPRSGSRIPNWIRVYPRVCGGTRSALCRFTVSRGLSPRVRGNLLKSSTVR